MFKEFKRLYDKYYFISAIIIAVNGVTRQYRDSVLGVLWTIIQPTIQVCIYLVVFNKIMRLPVENYLNYLVSTLLLWQFIATSLLTAKDSIISHADTIKRCIVPVTIFPFADALRSLYTYFVSFIIMFTLSTIINPKGFHMTAFMWPIFLIPLLVTLIAVCIAVSFITPYLRDLGDLINVGLNVSMWLTPIAYSIDIIPEEQRYLFEFNPFYIMIRPIIAVVYQGRIPSIYEMATQIGLMIFAVFVSYYLYKICRKNFVFYL
jgi:lipopolysaccharide transport system permease protein